MTSCLAKFLSDESGATALEYGIIASMIAIAIIASIKALGTELKVPFENINTAIVAANTAAK